MGLIIELASLSYILKSGLVGKRKKSIEKPLKLWFHKEKLVTLQRHKRLTQY